MKEDRLMWIIAIGALLLVGGHYLFPAQLMSVETICGQDMYLLEEFRYNPSLRIQGNSKSIGGVPSSEVVFIDDHVITFKYNIQGYTSPCHSRSNCFSQVKSEILNVMVDREETPLSVVYKGTDSTCTNLIDQPMHTSIHGTYSGQTTTWDIPERAEKPYYFIINDAGELVYTIVPEYSADTSLVVLSGVNFYMNKAILDAERAEEQQVEEPTDEGGEPSNGGIPTATKSADNTSLYIGILILGGILYYTYSTGKQGRRKKK